MNGKGPALFNLTTLQEGSVKVIADLQKLSDDESARPYWHEINLQVDVALDALRRVRHMGGNLERGTIGDGSSS